MDNSLFLLVCSDNYRAVFSMLRETLRLCSDVLWDDPMNCEGYPLNCEGYPLNCEGYPLNCEGYGAGGLLPKVSAPKTSRTISSMSNW
jgi:hypothetical protein